MKRRLTKGKRIVNEFASKVPSLLSSPTCGGEVRWRGSSLEKRGDRTEYSLEASQIP
jgi:hypothetical protein